MNPELLKMLACPICHQSLSLKVLNKTNSTEALKCKKCSKEFPIKDGIAKLIVSEGVSEVASEVASEGVKGKKTKK